MTNGKIYSNMNRTRNKRIRYYRDQGIQMDLLSNVVLNLAFAIESGGEREVKKTAH